MNSRYSQRESSARNSLRRRILFLVNYLFVGSLLALSGVSSAWADDGNSEFRTSAYKADDDLFLAAE